MKIDFKNVMDSFLNHFRSNKTLDKPMFDLKIILDFDIPHRARCNYIDDVMDKRKFTYLGSGRHRRTYLSPNKRYVLKFPHCRNGLYANQDEAKTWKESLHHPCDIAYAPCRLIEGSILMMVAVVEAYGGTDGCDNARSSNLIGGYDIYSRCLESNLPSWIENIDACQVGRTRNGKLVAYDYGL